MSFTSRDLDPLVRGDDWTFKLTITSSGSPVDITGYSYWFTLKTSDTDADPGALQTTTVAAGADALNGIIYVTAANADTIGITPGTFYYDIQQVDDLGAITTLLLGKVKVVRDITQSIV
jgi:hypothetical protein